MRVLSDLNSQTRKRIRGLIQVRDAVRRCLRSQLQGHDETEVLAARTELNSVYDSFVARNGPISLRENRRAFREDPDFPLLLSLENFDPETSRATKAAIFRERTIQRARPAQNVSDPKMCIRDRVTRAESYRPKVKCPLTSLSPVHPMADETICR